MRVLGFSPAGTASVYNLTVANAHAYYAEGVLVANCRYLVMGRPAPASYVEPFSYAPGTIGWMKQQYLTPRTAPLGARQVRRRRYAF